MDRSWYQRSASNTLPAVFTVWVPWPRIGPREPIGALEGRSRVLAAATRTPCGCRSSPSPGAARASSSCLVSRENFSESGWSSCRKRLLAVEDRGVLAFRVVGAVELPGAQIEPDTAQQGRVGI